MEIFKPAVLDIVAITGLAVAVIVVASHKSSSTTEISPEAIITVLCGLSIFLIAIGAKVDLYKYEFGITVCLAMVGMLALEMRRFTSGISSILLTCFGVVMALWASVRVVTEKKHD